VRKITIMVMLFVHTESAAKLDFPVCAGMVVATSEYPSYHHCTIWAHQGRRRPLSDACAQIRYSAVGWLPPDRALVNGDWIGVAGAALRTLLAFAPKKTLHISVVYVLPNLRRNRIGGKLFARTLDWGRTVGCHPTLEQSADFDLPPSLVRGRRSSQPSCQCTCTCTGSEAMPLATTSSRQSPVGAPAGMSKRQRTSRSSVPTAKVENRCVRQ
jgi:GNAT superfamily N-acetyltransferase